MKKYQLGALTVSDKGLQDTKEEIVIELIDRMQKYVAEGKAAYENRDYTEEQKLNAITNLCGRFCGLAEFLQITMGIDVRRAARDFLRVSFMTSAIVTATKADKPFTVVRVYGRY